jgi:hypothetical protein
MPVESLFLHSKNKLSMQLRDGLRMAMLLDVSAVNMQNSSSRGPSLRHLAKLACNVKDVTCFGSLIARDIDARLDSASLEEVISYGPIVQGDTPCAFITNEKVVTQKEWQLIGRLNASGILPEKTGIRFFNGLAQEAIDEKIAAENVMIGAAPRRSIVEPHLDLSSSSCLVMSCVFNDRAARIVADENLSFREMRERREFANSHHFVRAIQYQDDMADILCDLNDEVCSGVAHRNSVLACVPDHVAIGDLLQDMQPTLQRCARSWVSR